MSARRLVPAFALAVLAAALLAPAAGAYDLTEFDVTFTNAKGEAERQAGAHPDAIDVTLGLPAVPSGEGGEVIEEPPKDLLLTQIPGFVGNPYAVPRCSTVDFLTASLSVGGLAVSACPDATAVGIASVKGGGAKATGFLYGAVYNLAPPPGVAAKLGLWIEEVPVTIELGVAETPPYNIVGGPTNISQLVEVIGATFTLWGDPAAESHDPLRGRCINPTTGESDGKCPANISPVPFLTLPRSCEGPLRTLYKVDAWAHPGAFGEGFAETHDDLGEPAGFTGCGKLAFDPEAAARPTTAAAESASGLDFEIDVSDEGMANPEGIAKADIAATRLELPAGVTINPSAAEGLGTCSKAQFDAASLASQGCPDSAKLGSLEVTTPILPGHVLRGAFYQASQYDNPFGTLLAAYLTIKDEGLGVFVKLPARIDTDPATGRIVTTVADMPPFPLEHVRVHLRAGPRAPLVTPPACGTYTTEATLYPSSGGAPVTRESSFAIASGPGGSPCPSALPPFAPGFEAGSANPAAGAFSPFSMRITRADAEQDITGFSAVLPPGVVGKVAGIPPCPDAAIGAAAAKSGRAELAAPSCAAASAVGRVVAGAGVGSALTYVGGTLYLAGPYKGAPLSVVSIVPAVAGPFDVGTVITRVGLSLNPTTGVVEVDGSASDPIPHILRGVPLKLRDLRIYADRPGFTVNPTSCEPSLTAATIGGSGLNPFTPADDSLVPASARYQAASCASLGFKPKLRLRLTGATKRAKNPGLRAELRSRGGDANLKGAVVNLPPSQFIDNAHISNPCTRAQFAAESCPAASRLGWARAFTPLLDSPLEGPVYFKTNGGARKLPDLVATLRGTFDYDLTIAVLESKKERIRTKVLNAPDAPVSKFVLNMKPGKRSLLQNSEWLCKKKQKAYLNLGGQNGRRHKVNTKVRTSCDKKKQKKKASKRHGRRR